MRTVTFSAPEVQNVVSNHFVALTSNIEGDRLAGESIGHAPSELPGDCIRGNGRQNVQTIFMTPELEVMHVATGYISPAELLVEMQFVCELFERLKTEKGNRHDLVRASHADNSFRTGLEKQASRLLVSNPSLDTESRLTDSRMTGGGGAPLSLAKQDDRYMQKRPLITMKQFEEKPGELVGTGKTFFSSTRNSSQSVNGR